MGCAALAEDTKSSALRGVAWTTVSFAGQRLLQAAVTILLARLLVPEDYGIVALAQLTLTFIGLLRGTGVGAALIQHKDPTPAMLSSVFWFNAGIGLLSTLVVVALAGPLAWLLHEPRVEPVVLLLAPTFFLNAFTTVPGALLARSRAYKRYAFRETAAAAVSGGAAVALALSGFGLYALVGQSVARALFSIVFLWTATDWRPRLLFDRESLRPLLAYGMPLAWSNVLAYLQRNLDNLLVGRFLGAAALGLYSFAYGMLMSPVLAVQSILGRVMFPEMSRIRDDLARVRAVYLGSVRYIAGATWLPLGGLLVLAPLFVPLVFGGQWRPAIPLLQVFTFLALLQVVATTVGWIYASQGQTKKQFRVGLVASIPVYAAFAVGLRWGLEGVAIAYLVAQLALAWPFNRIAFAVIGLKVTDVLRELRGLALVTVHMLAVLYVLREALLRLTDLPDAAILVAGALVGAADYLLLFWLVEPELLRRLWSLPKELRNPRKPPGPPPPGRQTPASPDQPEPPGGPLDLTL